MIAELIKEHTHTHHQALEASMVRRIKAIAAPEDYVTLLQIFYSYFGGLEKQIKLSIAGTLPDLEQRRKADDLAKDIQHFGGSIPTLAEGKDLPEMTTPLQAMAALYVIEGSTLGGIYISKMIAKQLNIEDGEGLRFFNGYGEQTQQKWEKFKTIFNALPQNEEEQQQMIATADDTFLKFKLWMDKW